MLRLLIIFYILLVMNNQNIKRLVESRKNPLLRTLNNNIAWGWAHIHKRIPEHYIKMANNDPNGYGMHEYMAEVEMEIAKFLRLGRRMNLSEEAKQYVADTMRWKAYQMIKGAPKGGARVNRRRRTVKRRRSHSSR